jgi:RimJ/RimL family protein N-acetyltransferase
MQYLLKNGKNVTIRKPRVEDAEAIINVMTIADTETLFLARNPGEFCTPVEREKQIIENVLADNDVEWFVAEYENKVIGQCSVGLVRRNARYRHRAEVAFVILQDYCNLGIGGKMMEECIKWCEKNGVTQIELDVVKNNERALKMYQGFGFEIIGTKENALRYQDGTYADEYLMVKKL